MKNKIVNEMSKKTSHYRDLYTMKLLFYIGNVTCLLPPFDFRNEKCVKSRLYVFYAILIAVVNGTFGGLASYYRIKEAYGLLKSTISVMDFTANVMTTITFVVVIVRMSIWKRNDVADLFHSITTYNRKSNINMYKKSGKNYFYTEMIAYHLLYLAYVVFDAYVWIGTLGYTIFQHYLFREIQYYYILTFGFIIYNLAIIIRDCFIHLNEKLESNITMANNITIVRELGSKRGVHQWKDNNGVKEINKLYIALCDIIDKFNKVFGAVIVLLALNFIIGLLQPINIGLVYSTSQESMGDQSFGCDLAILCVLWASIYIVRMLQFSI